MNMAISVTFELSDQDLEHFRGLMESAVERAGNISEQHIIEEASKMSALADSEEMPDFIRQRLKSLPALVDMLQDQDWQLPEEERKGIRTALAYLQEPSDILPDHIPVFGYMDDAIMIELVIQELSLDLTAYREFCAFRQTEINRRGEEANVNRDNWLGGKRSELHSRIRKGRKERRSRSVFGRIF
jgi:uncharacterized membrane protein YkvA (DUF1232 family)